MGEYVSRKPEGYLYGKQKMSIYEVIIFIIYIRVKVVNLNILDNIPVNIAPMNIKRFMEFNL